MYRVIRTNHAEVVPQRSRQCLGRVGRADMFTPTCDCARADQHRSHHAIIHTITQFIPEVLVFVFTIQTDDFVIGKTTKSSVCMVNSKPEQRDRRQDGHGLLAHHGGRLDHDQGSLLQFHFILLY